MAKNVVTAPLVIAYAEDGTAHHLYKGAVLDDRFGADEVKRLRDEGFVEAEKAKASKSAKSPGSGGSPGDEAPGKNASTEEWQTFARSKGASDADLKDENGDDLGRDALVEKFGG